MSEWCRDLGDRDVGVTGSWGEIVTSVTCVTFSGRSGCVKILHG